MSLRSQQQQWEYLAVKDPFWAIITDASKKGCRWDPEEFYATGRHEIRDAIRHMDRLGFPQMRRTALDFGCGAGRLTQALSQWFDRVTGVDISPAMLELARRHNRAGARCSFILNTVDDLRQFEDSSFDLVYSHIVLQHLPPRFARRYVREFVRLLRPAGLALFQLPSTLRSPSPWYGLRYRCDMIFRRRILREADRLEMYGVPRETVVADLKKTGARILEVAEDESAGAEWKSYVYAVTRNEP